MNMSLKQISHSCYHDDMSGLTLEYIPIQVGVSRSTALRVINNPPNISEDIPKRAPKVIQSFGTMLTWLRAPSPCILLG